MYAAQPAAAASAKAIPPASAAPCQGSREEDHARGGGRRPELQRTAAARGRDAERSEELERARRAEGQPGDGRHEAEGHGRGHDAEDRRRDESASGEGARARPDEHEEQDARPRKAKGRRAVGADVVEQPDRQGDPDLHADHRRERHGGAGMRPGGRVGGQGGPGHGPSEQPPDRLVHVDLFDIPFDVLEQSSTMDPHRLRLLLELSRRGSMRAVADELGYTTSTVSQQLAVLGREAGATLIEPEGRRVRLTPAGRRLADHAVTILAALEAARADLDPDGEPAGTVRVAGFASAVRRSLVPVLARLSTEHPAVRLRIHEHEPAEAFELLAADEVDLALVYDYTLAPVALDPALRVTPLWSAAWQLGVPAAGGAGGGERMTTRRRSSGGSPTPGGSSTRATRLTSTWSGPSRRSRASSRGSRTAPTASSSCRTSSSPASASRCSPRTAPSPAACGLSRFAVRTSRCARTR